MYKKRSKKKVKWHINHKHNEHVIEGVISFSSGKKKVTHNGLTVLNMQRYMIKYDSDN